MEGIEKKTTREGKKKKESSLNYEAGIIGVLSPI